MKIPMYVGSNPTIAGFAMWRSGKRDGMLIHLYKNHKSRLDYSRIYKMPTITGHLNDDCTLQTCTIVDLYNFKLVGFYPCGDESTKLEWIDPFIHF